MQTPPYALPVWADDDNIYVQVPSDKGPVTITFPIQGGLSKVLPLFQHKVRTAPPPPPIAKPPSVIETTAARVLRNMGLMG